VHRNWPFFFCESPPSSVHKLSIIENPCRGKVPRTIVLQSPRPPSYACLLKSVQRGFIHRALSAAAFLPLPIPMETGNLRDFPNWTASGYTLSYVPSFMICFQATPNFRLVCSSRCIKKLLTSKYATPYPLPKITSLSLPWQALLGGGVQLLHFCSERTALSTRSWTPPRSFFQLVVPSDH